MLNLEKVIDDLQAFFDLLVVHLSPWNQRAIFDVDVGPVNSQDSRSFRRVDRTREGSAILSPNGDGRTPLVLIELLGGWCTDPDLIDKLIDDKILNLGLGCMQPGESMVGYAGGQEVGRSEFTMMSANAQTVEV